MKWKARHSTQGQTAGISAGVPHKMIVATKVSFLLAGKERPDTLYLGMVGAG